MKQNKLFGLTSVLLVLLMALFSFNGCSTLEDIIGSEDNTSSAVIDNTDTDNNTSEPDSSVGIGETLWIHHLPQGEVQHYASLGEPLAIGPDGTLYYEAGGHGWNTTNWDPIEIYAVNKSDGSLKWKSEPLAIWHINGNIMIGDEGNVYAASYTKLYSLNPSDGSVNWVWEVPHTLPDSNGNDVNTYGELGFMTLTNSNDIIIKTMGSGSYFRAYYCINPEGTTKWYQFNSSYSSGPMSIGKDGMLYDITKIDNIYVLAVRDPGTGLLSWTLPIETSNLLYNNLVFTEDGDVITFTRGDNLARISTTSHQVKWEIASGASRRFKFIAPDGNIYVYSQFTGWYIYDASNGNQINSGLFISSQPINIDDKFQIYGTLRDDEGFVKVTDKVGTESWRTSMMVGGATITVSDNVLYFWSTDNGEQALFALKTDGSLSHSGWPRFWHDNRNTFNFNKR